MSTPADFSQYPLADLHLHLDGSVSIASARQLAALQNIEIPTGNESLGKLLTVSPDCRNLNEYLEKFAFPGTLLQTREALTISVRNLLNELKVCGLGYAEVRFAPQKHTYKGLSQQEVVEAVIAGWEDSPVAGGMLLCCMRDKGNEAENEETIELAHAYLGRGVLGADLAGAEGLFPTRDFEFLFRKAARLGVPFTIHAGEADGPASVRKALDFGARRIGHGVRSIEDPQLVKELADNAIVLELCPTSNMQTCVFDKIEDYPLRELMEAGVKVTLNTDNMSVSGTTLPQEFALMEKTFRLTPEELLLLRRNAWEGRLG